MRYPALFTIGPTPAWLWTGVCEITQARDRHMLVCVHHPHWPTRSHTVPFLLEPTQVAKLVADGKWAPLVPYDLEVDEGL